MTRKQVFKMIDRLENQLSALKFYTSVSRIPEVKKLLDVKFGTQSRLNFKQDIESLKNDLILTIVALKKDTF